MSEREAEPELLEEESTAASMEVTRPFGPRLPASPPPRPSRREVDRDALQKKLEALAGDVRTQASQRDRPPRPDDARTEYAAFVLPATESGQKPDLLKVVVGLGVDPRADPTVMASRIRDSVKHAFSGSPRKGRWHAITALGLIGSAAIVGIAFVHPGARTASDSMQARSAHAFSDGSIASPGGPSPVEVPSAATSAQPIEAAAPDQDTPALVPSAQPLLKPQPTAPKKKPARPYSPKHSRNTPIGKGPDY